MRLRHLQSGQRTFLQWHAPRWNWQKTKLASWRFWGGRLRDDIVTLASQTVEIFCGGKFPDETVTLLMWTVEIFAVASSQMNCDTPNVNRWDFCSGKFPGETVRFHLCSGVIQVLLTNLNLIRGSAQPFSSIEALLSLKSCHLFWTSERNVLGNIVFFPLVYPEIRLTRDRVKLQEAPCLLRCLVCSQLRWKGRRTDLFTPVAMQLLVWAWANSSGADLGGSGKYPHEEFGKQIQVNSNGQWTWVSRSSEKGMF